MVCIPDRHRLYMLDITTHNLDSAESTVSQLPRGGAVLCTCPEGQAQHCLVHGVLETEVWNDLEVVGGMKCIGCNRAIKEEISGFNSGCLSDNVQ